MEKYNIQSSSELADRTELTLDVVRGILQGEEKIDSDVAEKLSMVFGKSAVIMLRMQKVADFYDKNGRRPRSDELDAVFLM